MSFVMEMMGSATKLELLLELPIHHHHHIVIIILEHWLLLLLADHMAAVVLVHHHHGWILEVPWHRPSHLLGTVMYKRTLSPQGGLTKGFQVGDTKGRIIVVVGGMVIIIGIPL